MDQTQAFLARVLPWNEYPEAFRTIHFTGKKMPDGSMLHPGAACRTLNEATHMVGVYSGKLTNVYVCTSLQIDCKGEQKTVNGQGRLPMAVRKKSNTLGSRTFYLDIDVKDGAYQTTAQALVALKGMITQHSLPLPTMIVSSGGGGIHAYWVVDRLLQVAEWQVIAHGLDAAATISGVHHDSNVTNDIVHLMRVPGSFNYKYQPAKHCGLMGKIQQADVPISDFKQALSNFLPSNVVSLPSRSPVPMGPSEFSAGVTLRSDPIPMEKLAKACPVVADALQNHGAHHSGGGIWPLMVLLSTFLEDGRAWAHELSSGHAGYDPAATDLKYDQKVAMRAASPALGWPACSTIHKAFPTGACNTCPNLSLGKSPLNFSDPASAASARLPANYYQNEGGIWHSVIVGDEPKVTNICTYQVSEPWLDTSIEGAHQLSFKFSQRNAQRGSATVVADKTNHQLIQPLLARQRFNLTATEAKRFSEFAMAWIKELQALNQIADTTPALGWVGEGQITGFAYNNVVHMPTGKTRTSHSDTSIIAPWTPTGDLAAWKGAAQFITGQKRPALEAILAASFAGPLVRFTGHRGLLASAYSPDTGIGKTTAMSIAAAVWGHPVDSSQALDDTAYSSLKRLGAIRSLTLFWDEVRVNTGDKTDKLANLIFALTTGRERTRLTANATMQVAGKWQTMLITASNQSVLEIAKNATTHTDAGGVRVFEWRVPPAAGPATITSSEATRIAAAAASNYGQAGTTYAEFLGKNFKAVENAVSQLSDALNKQTNAVPDERFWISSIATMLVGAGIAKRLGLVDFDLMALKDFCLDTLATLRMDRSGNTGIGTDTLPKVMELIGTYLAEARYDATIETTDIPNTYPVTVHIDNPVDRLRTVNVHIDNTMGMIYLRAAPFYGWLYERGLQRKATLDGLKRLVGANEQRAVLGARTSYSIKTPVNCVAVPLKALQGAVP